MSVIRKSSALIALFLGMFATTARAQETLTATVPFPFVVGHEEFPAGQYEIHAADDGPFLSIEGMKNKRVGVALTMPAEGSDPTGWQPALVFTRYENGYRLSQIWESRTEGQALLGRSTTRKTTRAEAAVQLSDTQVYVLASDGR